MKNHSFWLVLGIIAAGIFLRLQVYGDLRLSVAINDTQDYINSAKVNLLSWNAFNTYRPYTMNLVYNLFGPDKNYKITAISGAQQGTSERKIQSGFKVITPLQIWMSILAWGLFAFSIASTLQKIPFKFIASTLIILFGFTPQIADWDSILSSESLSISLFFIFFSLLLIVSQRMIEKRDLDFVTVVLAIVCLLVYFLWAFSRDSHIYSSTVLLLALLVSIFLTRGKKRVILIALSVFILIFFVVGLLSNSQRPAININLRHVFNANIIPFGTRVSYFQDRGMPDLDSKEFDPWFEEQSVRLYAMFLIAHPGYTSQAFFKDLNYAFVENSQPYFITHELAARKLLTDLGDNLHIKSSSVYYQDLFVLISLMTYLIWRRDFNALIRCGLFAVLFLIANIVLFMNIFGDTYALHRHTLFAVTSLRLLQWVLLLTSLDLLFHKLDTEEPIQSPDPE